MERTVYDIIIIGCGPAGMTAAIYARRMNLSVVVVDGGVPGGMMVNTEEIDNYPGFEKVRGTDLALAMYDQMMKLGTTHEFINVSNVRKEEDLFIASNGEKEIIGKSVIVATGTKNKTLGLDSERKYFYQGISWCAICDGPLYKGKDVAVIGGGNSALSSALTLSKFVRKVYLVHRRDEFRGDPLLVDNVKEKDNIEIIYNSNVIEFSGNPLDKITILNKNGDKRELSIACCFEAIGRLPNSEFVDCDKDNDGFIIVNEKMETSVKGMFACGDIIKKGLRQVATAVGDGAIAAMSASSYIK